jgi:type VI secretion system secreted protein VgrG
LEALQFIDGHVRIVHATTLSGRLHAGDVVAQHAQASLTIASNDAAGRSTAPIGVAGDLGGKTLASGLYKSTSSLAITGTLTLHGSGVYIFQVASALTVDTGGSVVLSGGAAAANVFWQVGSSATLGTTADVKGTIMALGSVTVGTGAKLNGRALALHGAVTLDSNSVTIPLLNAVLVVLPPPPPRNED